MLAVWFQNNDIQTKNWRTFSKCATADISLRSLGLYWSNMEDWHHLLLCTIWCKCSTKQQKVLTQTIFLCFQLLYAQQQFWKYMCAKTILISYLFIFQRAQKQHLKQQCSFLWTSIWEHRVNTFNDRNIQREINDCILN